MPEREEYPGHAALAQIDHVLRRRPVKDDHALSHATMCLAQFRDALLNGWRSGTLTDAQRKELRHVNAVITVVLGVHFPLGQVPWHELEKAREWLADVVRQDEPV